MTKTRKNPWFKFFPSDWRADPKLRTCSLAARGLWVELLCIMHEATPRGHLLVNGKAPSDSQLCALVGVTSEDLQRSLAELQASGVFSSTREGVMFSRRMVTDERNAEKCRRNGKKGGNPTLRKTTTNSAGVSPEVKAQIPEARSQKPEYPFPSQEEEPLDPGDTRVTPFDVLRGGRDG